MHFMWLLFFCLIKFTYSLRASTVSLCAVYVYMYTLSWVCVCADLYIYHIALFLTFLKTIKTLSCWYSLVALAEYSQMTTHVPGFESFFSCCFLHHFVLAKLATSSVRVKGKKACLDFLNNQPPVFIKHS